MELNPEFKIAHIADSTIRQKAKSLLINFNPYLELYFFILQINSSFQPNIWNDVFGQYILVAYGVLIRARRTVDVKETHRKMCIFTQALFILTTFF